MKLSVLVTFYNQQRYVRRCLDSVLRQQTSFDYEVLVGDDGSSDGTVEAVQAYAAEHSDKVKLFCMPRDAETAYDSVVRASANRLNLLAQAKGDFFCVLDGDDYYLDDHFFARSVNLLESKPKCSGCGAAYARVRAGEVVERKFYSGKAQLISLPYYVTRAYIHAGAFIFRKPAPDAKLEYLQRVGLFDDVLITYYMLNFGDLYYFPIVSYAYRMEGEGICAGFSAMEKNLWEMCLYTAAKSILPPGLRRYAARSFLGPAQRIFANRSGLSENLGEHAENLWRLRARRQGAVFVSMVLDWRNLGAERSARLEKAFRLFVVRSKIYGLKAKLQHIFS